MANINASMWSDDKFVMLTESAQRLWCFLLTGPHTNGWVPGLFVAGIGSVAEGARVRGQRMDESAAAVTFKELLDFRMVEHDPQRMLIRIPHAPRWSPPGNPNVLKGWWRRWRDLPECVLKYRHVGSLREGFQKANRSKPDAWDSVWATTFDSAPVLSHTNQQDLWDSGLLKPFERYESGTGSGSGSGTGSRSLSKAIEAGREYHDPPLTPLEVELRAQRARRNGGS